MVEDAATIGIFVGDRVPVENPIGRRNHACPCSGPRDEIIAYSIDRIRQYIPRKHAGLEQRSVSPSEARIV